MHRTLTRKEIEDPSLRLCNRTRKMETNSRGLLSSASSSHKEFHALKRIVLCVLALCLGGKREHNVVNGYQSLGAHQASGSKHTSFSSKDTTPHLQNALPIAKLYSVEDAPPNAKIIHFIRHAEGTHNIQNVPYKEAAHLDARLTPAGMDQCRTFAQQKHPTLAELPVECIVASPLTRTLQTAQLCFEGRVRTNLAKCRTASRATQVSARHDTRFPTSPLACIPLVACEHWRETVNYLCDKRRDVSTLQTEFPYVDFAPLQPHDADPIWSQYDMKYGSHSRYMEHREAKDKKALKQRARKAWTALAARPEKSIAVVSHRTFYGHLFGNMEGSVVSYHNDKVKEFLTGNPFDNCELRSVAFVPVIPSENESVRKSSLVP
jgi:broad specificity phosphatase PhoE